MGKFLSVAVVCAACLAGAPSWGADSTVALGRQRAAASKVAWEVKEIVHPVLGPIVFASRKVAITTVVGKETIVSQAYVSCQKGYGKIAIELSNALASNPTGGLKPRVMPRLTCYSPDPKVSGALTMGDMDLKWTANDLGDVMARGISPADLRRCISIDVLEDLLVPAGASRQSQQVLMEFLPYDAAMEAVAAACSGGAAKGRSTAIAAAPPRAPAPAAAPANAATGIVKRPVAADASWRPAHTISAGRSNVRAGPAVNTHLVTTVPAGTKVLVQKAKGDWWKVKPRTGSRYGGYIREDRLVLE